MWKFLPIVWREQWKEEVSNIHGESVLVDITDTLFVEDMTEGKTIYHKNMDLQNLESTSWENFVKCFEKYVALRIVRCPCGCCESLNKVNLIPYDVVVSHYIKKSIPMYTDTKGKDRKYGSVLHIIHMM